MDLFVEMANSPARPTCLAEKKVTHAFPNLTFSSHPSPRMSFATRILRPTWFNQRLASPARRWQSTMPSTFRVMSTLFRFTGKRGTLTQFNRS